MELTINNKINNFKLYRSVPVDELKAECLSFIHEPTGLELIWLKREEENKTFGIAFSTLPWNDTGVFHILEHSVLCGSEKYPVKEPFVELMKGSLNTFLNALTFSDKTFYPVSTRNNADYENLMRVYLDAVFHPLIYKKPEIFMQEGWHYEFDENGKVSYKGVVFNEMKGAFSSDDEIADTAIERALFPNSPYGFVSGGDPKSIPNLSYEEFINTHKRFYSPSNAYIFLDGDIDIENILGIIDREYLSGFEKGERMPYAAMQQPVDAGTIEISYEISKDEDEKLKNKMAYGRVIGSFDDIEKLVSVQILADVLCGSNQAPVCKAVLSEKLAEDVSFDIRDGILQPWLEIKVSNYKKEDEEKIDKLITSELERLSLQGLDRDMLEASVSNLEFRLRENDFGSYPQGIVYGIDVMSSVLFGGNPELNLIVGDLFERIRSKVNQGYFEELIKSVILNNNHRCKILLIPSKNEGEKRQKEEEARIEKECASWTDKERAYYTDIENKLKEWQMSADTEEQSRTIPSLSLKDVGSMPELLPTEVKNINGIETLIHNIPSNGISYINLYFDIRDFEKDDISAASYLAAVLGNIKTENYDAESLITKTDLLIGNVSYGVKPVAMENPNKFKIYFNVKLSILDEKLKDALELVSEILTKSDTSDSSLIEDLLKQEYSDVMQNIIMSGHSMAVGRVKAQLSAVGAADEYANGLDAYYWIKQVVSENDFCAVAIKFKELIDKIFCRSRLLASITSDKYENAELMTKVLSGSLPLGTAADKESEIKPFGIRKEAIVIPSDVSYAASACSYGRYSGSVALCTKLLSLGYLWNEVRVQGGAYGVGMLHRDPEIVAFYSYRDPSGSKSLEKYKDSSAYLQEFCKDQGDFDGFIIGCIADSSPVLTPRLKGSRADTFYLSEFSYKRHCEIRKQLLETSFENIENFASNLEKGMENPAQCIVGGEKQVQECSCDLIFNL